jgi:hypothetical protein
MVRFRCNWSWWNRVVWRVEIGSQSCREKSLSLNYTGPLIWFPFHCPSLFYSCAFSGKLLRDTILWHHVKKMSEYNYVTEQCSWKRRQPQSWLVSCFFSFKAIRCFQLCRREARIPVLQAPLCQLLEWHWTGKYCRKSRATPQRGWWGAASVELHPAGACSTPATVVSQLVCSSYTPGEGTASSGIYSKVPFLLPPSPSGLIQICAQA